MEASLAVAGIGKIAALQKSFVGFAAKFPSGCSGFCIESYICTLGPVGGS